MGGNNRQLKTFAFLPDAWCPLSFPSLLYCYISNQAILLHEGRREELCAKFKLSAAGQIMFGMLALWSSSIIKCIGHLLLHLLATVVSYCCPQYVHMMAFLNILQFWFSVWNTYMWLTLQCWLWVSSVCILWRQRNLCSSPVEDRCFPQPPEGFVRPLEAKNQYF